MDYEVSRHAKPITTVSDQIARQHKAGLHLPLPKSVEREIENRLAEQCSIMRLDQIREKIREKRGYDDPLRAVKGLSLGALVGLGLWGVVVAVVWLMVRS